ncbi:MAG: S41 family peptidase [Clostridiales bacterium]|nr:S41 family peptidase [Roseburia sp.]MDD7636498.1 S41 family peptidase [Clostridiales bacterium]MDY4112184.1 S41 family peptidase [Roseburia sp.]
MNEHQENGMIHQESNAAVPEKCEKKSGLWKGILLGVFLTMLIGTIGIYLVCLVTGSRIMITNRGSRLAGEGGAVLDSEAISKINELAAYIDLYYYDEIDAESLKNGLYAGLIDGVEDKYSTYYTAEEYQQSQVSMTGKYYGIGAGLTQDTSTMVVSVTKIYEGTPSEAAGLLAEDIILSVDGVDATSMEVTELVQLIRGEEGTTVHLEVYRPGTGEYLSFDVERANVTLPSVDSEMLTEEIGYIRIESFETDTAHQFEQALTELEGAGMQSLVVDLRYNGGGLVDSVVQILDDILPEGLLVYTEDKYGNRQEYKSSGDTHFDYPLVVLINQDSASASEIFAGAIKDYEYGTLIGTTTFGKGIVQSVFKLSDGDAVKLTTAKYFTPNGNYIHGVGIEPDIELEYEYLNPEGESYEMQYDNQIQKAIEVLSEE